jgi:hypothetical protein
MIIDTFAGGTHTGCDDQKSWTDLGAEDRRLFARRYHSITAHLGC